MRIHHLNCGTLCPVAAGLLIGPPKMDKPCLYCHCLLIETDAGLVLVDTGFALRDCEPSTTTLDAVFRMMVRPVFDKSETAIAQVRALGFKPEDVRHIVLTHMDLDHAGGLVDFPWAKVHVTERELNIAKHPETAKEKKRYVQAQWSHHPDFHTYEPRGEQWRGFECVRELHGLPPEILMVPLHGHTRGHAGVAVDSGSGWLLHAGDAYFYHGEMDVQNPSCPLGLRIFQTAMGWDNSERLANQARLRELVRDSTGEVRVFSAHDARDFAKQQRLTTST